MSGVVALVAAPSGPGNSASPLSAWIGGRSTTDPGGSDTSDRDEVWQIRTRCRIDIAALNAVRRAGAAAGAGAAEGGAGRIAAQRRRAFVGIWTLCPPVRQRAAQSDRRGRDALGGHHGDADRPGNPARAPVIGVVFGILLVESVQPRIRPAHDGPPHRPDAGGRPAAGRDRHIRRAGQRHDWLPPIPASHRDRHRRHGIVDG